MIKKSFEWDIKNLIKEKSIYMLKISYLKKIEINIVIYNSQVKKTFFQDYQKKIEHQITIN